MALGKLPLCSLGRGQGVLRGKEGVKAVSISVEKPVLW